MPHACPHAHTHAHAHTRTSPSSGPCQLSADCLSSGACVLCRGSWDVCREGPQQVPGPVAWVARAPSSTPPTSSLSTHVSVPVPLPPQKSTCSTRGLGGVAGCKWSWGGLWVQVHECCEFSLCVGVAGRRSLLRSSGSLAWGPSPHCGRLAEPGKVVPSMGAGSVRNGGLSARPPERPWSWGAPGCLWLPLLEEVREQGAGWDQKTRRA